MPGDTRHRNVGSFTYVRRSQQVPSRPNVAYASVDAPMGHPFACRVFPAAPRPSLVARSVSQAQRLSRPAGPGPAPSGRWTERDPSRSARACTGDGGGPWMAGRRAGGRLARFVEIGGLFASCVTIEPGTQASQPGTGWAAVEADARTAQTPEPDAPSRRALVGASHVIGRGPSTMVPAGQHRRRRRAAAVGLA